MYPGAVSRVTESRMASAYTIHPRSDIVYLTGTTVVHNIVPTFGGRAGQVLFIIAAGNAVTLFGGSGPDGNIYIGGTIPVSHCGILLWSRTDLGSGWALVSGFA